MDTKPIYAMVSEFVRDLHPNGTGDLLTSASFEELGIDSMSTIDLMNKVEKEFGIEVPDEKLPVIVNVQDLVDFIDREVS